MKVFLGMLLFVASVAHAVEVKVAQVPVDHFRPKAEVSYAINKDAGRAWIEVDLSDTNRRGDGFGRTTVRSKVEGLVFNAETSTIQFTHEGQLFDCATVTRRWYGNKIRPTGCELKIRKVTVQEDDGYRWMKRTYHQVFLVTK